MFAVPGWKIATQAPVPELIKPVKQKSRQDTASQDEPSTISKKRKRDQGSHQQGSATTGSPNKPLPSANSDPSTKISKKQHNFRDSKKSAEPSNPNGRPDDRKTPSSNVAHEKWSPVADIVNRMSHGRARVDHRSQSKSVRQDKREKVIAVSNLLPAETNGHPQRAEPRTSAPVLAALPPAPANLTPLQAKMRAKLTSARFRYINETLYTTSSFDALRLFTDSPDLFADYHAGFSQQVHNSWPQNPVDLYLSNIKERGSLVAPSRNFIPLPRRRNGTCNIADLGCGDAPLARALQPVKKKLGLRFCSFDLHTPNEYVTKADISALPLGDGEADVAIFCLSLMGINWLSFVEEAWRVVRGDGKGEVWVAEVKSRFGRLSARQGHRKVVENSVGKRQKLQAKGKKSRLDGDGDVDSTLAEVESEISNTITDDTDLEPFIHAFSRRGFVLREGSVDKSNKMFVSMIFTKVGVPRAGKWKGFKWTGKAYEKSAFNRPGKSIVDQRFQGGQNSTNQDDEIDEKDEGKILKPCVYKLR